MHTILNFIHAAENVISRSVRTAAFYSAAAGLVIAILIVRIAKRKKKNKKSDTDYSTEGMCLGMSKG